MDFVNKIKSRKFIVFVIWTILVIFSIIWTKSIDATVISYYGIISGLYLGGNTLQHIKEKV
jgi:hypothetical protein